LQEENNILREQLIKSTNNAPLYTAPKMPAKTPTPQWESFDTSGDNSNNTNGVPIPALPTSPMPKLPPSHLLSPRSDLTGVDMNTSHNVFDDTFDPRADERRQHKNEEVKDNFGLDPFNDEFFHAQPCSSKGQLSAEIDALNTQLAEMRTAFAVGLTLGGTEEDIGGAAFVKALHLAESKNEAKE
jgi:hypothetical protein